MAISRLGTLLLFVAATLLFTGGCSVTTQHNNNFRTGTYDAENLLTPYAVSTRGMEIKYTRGVTGAIGAQPLYVPRVSFTGGQANGLFVATMQNLVYAFNADTGAQLWVTTLSDTSTTRPKPRGVPSTPVIDESSATMYVLFSTKNQSVDSAETANAEMALQSTLDVAYWLVALDLKSGVELRRVQVSASSTRSDGSSVTFVAKDQVNHPALLLDGGALYLAFGSRFLEGIVEYHGWVIRYNAATFAPAGAFCTSVDAGAGDGAGIWQGGGGLAADLDGSVYFATGNGHADRLAGAFGDSVVKLLPSASSLTLGGAFQPADAAELESKDLDLGSGGVLLIPDSPYVVAGGKTGVVYLIDRGSMALVQEFQAFTNSYHPDWDHGCPSPLPANCQDWAAGPHLHGSPTFWRGPDPNHGYYYHWAEKDFLKRYHFDYSTGRFDEAPLVGPVRATDDLMPGGMLSVSNYLNQPGSGIVWATLPTHQLLADGKADHIYAFDANTLEILWDSPFPATLPRMGKWMPPTIASGKVIIATNDNGFAVYHLGPLITQPFPPGPLPSSSFLSPCQPGPRPDTVPLTARFESEEAVSVLPALRRQQLAPPDGAIPKFSARAFGGCNEQEEALTELGGDHGDGMEVPFGRRVGNLWVAADGSAVEAVEFRSVPAPDKGGEPWQLFHVVVHSGAGRLSTVDWIERSSASWLGGQITYVFLGTNAQRGGLR
jgi:outer membrane protein assembly factor BamB